MIIINGRPFSQENAIIVNGRSICLGEDVTTRKFDEKRSEEAKNIEKIEIYGLFAEVNISASNSSKIEVHFYGQVKTEGDIDFNVSKAKDKLKIVVKANGNAFYPQAHLYVKVPRKSFKSIYVKTSSGDIILNDKVAVRSLYLKTEAGNVQTSAIFTNAHISTMSGKASICIDAREDISLEIKTMSGDVSTKLENVRYIDLYTDTKSGKIKKIYTEGSGYIAYVDVTTMSGNITIE